MLMVIGLSISFCLFCRGCKLVTSSIRKACFLSKIPKDKLNQEQAHELEYFEDSAPVQKQILFLLE